MFRLLKVRGASLWPYFHEGDYVLTAGVPFPGGRVKPGDAIVFQQPGYGVLIKRVIQILADGKEYEVQGTQVSSTDSRNFGPVPREHVLGKVILHIRAKQ